MIQSRRIKMLKGSPETRWRFPLCRGSEQAARNSHLRNIKHYSTSRSAASTFCACDKHVRLDHINADIWKNSFPPDPLLTFAAGFTLISARWEKKNGITQFSPEGSLFSFRRFHQGFTPVMFPTKYLCRRRFNSCRNGVRAAPQRRRRRRRPG